MARPWRQPFPFSLAMDDCPSFRPFKSPLDTRLVVFKSMVYKVKCCFRNSIEMDRTPVKVTESIQEETRKVLLVYLNLLSELQILRPIHSTNAVVYPFIRPWQAQAILKFYKDGQRLPAFKQSLTLYVEVKTRLGGDTPASPLNLDSLPPPLLNDKETVDSTNGLKKRECVFLAEGPPLAKRLCVASPSLPTSDGRGLPALPTGAALQPVEPYRGYTVIEDTECAPFNRDSPQACTDVGEQRWFFQRLWTKLKSLVGM